MSGYFGGVSPGGFFTPWTNLNIKRGSPSLYQAMRFHINDPITFSNSLKIQWQAGDTTSGNTFTGTVTVFFTLWFYTS